MNRVLNILFLKSSIFERKCMKQKLWNNIKYKFMHNRIHTTRLSKVNVATL